MNRANEYTNWLCTYFKVMFLYAYAIIKNVIYVLTFGNVNIFSDFFG